MDKQPEGWTDLENAARLHYFVEGRSLCGKWGYMGRDLTPVLEDVPNVHDNLEACTACQKRVTSRQRRARKEG